MAALATIGFVAVFVALVQMERAARRDEETARQK
jgi:hypothetical protein